MIALFSFGLVISVVSIIFFYLATTPDTSAKAMLCLFFGLFLLMVSAVWKITTLLSLL